jgi:hypothetical protein
MTEHDHGGTITLVEVIQSITSRPVLVRLRGDRFRRVHAWSPEFTPLPADDPPDPLALEAWTQ